jgi:hypothetical protein
VTGGREDQVDPTGQRRVAFPEPERLARHVGGEERRRARGVDGDGRAPQIEHVRHPPGGDAAGDTRREVGVDIVEDPSLQGLVGVLRAGHADEHARARSGERAGRDAGVLQRLRGQLEQEPLLGVHRDRLAR